MPSDESNKSAGTLAGIFRAGAAAVAIDPPLGLPMSGSVQRVSPATSRLAPLEVTALAFACGQVRVVLCGEARSGGRFKL